MEGVWPQLEGLLARRGGCTYLSHGTREFGATICLMTLARWFLAPRPVCASPSILRCAGMWGAVPPSRTGVRLFQHLLSRRMGLSSLLPGWLPWEISSSWVYKLENKFAPRTDRPPEGQSKWQQLRIPPCVRIPGQFTAKRSQT